jgi:hypothetical protein
VCAFGRVSMCCLSLQDVEGLVSLFGSPAGRALVAASSSGKSGSSTSRLLGGSRKKDGLVSKNRRKERRKSSSELYREAAALLGLTCSMSDSCRCIECQVIVYNLNARSRPLNLFCLLVPPPIFSRLI